VRLVSRVLFLDGHFSSPAITDGVKQPTRSAIFQCLSLKEAFAGTSSKQNLFGLAPRGVYPPRFSRSGYFVPAARADVALVLPPPKAGVVGVTHHAVLGARTFLPRQRRERPSDLTFSKIQRAIQNTHQSLRLLICPLLHFFRGGCVLQYILEI